MKRRITIALDDERDSLLSIRQLQSELGDEVSGRVLDGLLGSEDILVDDGSNGNGDSEEAEGNNDDDDGEEVEGNDSDDSSEDGEGSDSDDSSVDGEDSDSDDSSDEGESSDEEEEEDEMDEKEEDDDNEGDSGIGMQPSPTRVVPGFITLVPGFQPTTIDDDAPPSPTSSPVRPPESETPELPLVPIPPRPTTSVEAPWPQLTVSPAPPDKTTTSGADNVQQPTETAGGPAQTEETQPGSLDPLTGELRSGDSGMSNGAAVGVTLGVLSK
jgi:hypothetical protein